MIDIEALQTKLNSYSNELDFGSDSNSVWGKFDNITESKANVISDIESYLIEGWNIGSMRFEQNDTYLTIELIKDKDI